MAAVRWRFPPHLGVDFVFAGLREAQPCVEPGGWIDLSHLERQRLSESHALRDDIPDDGRPHSAIAMLRQNGDVDEPYPWLRPVKDDAAYGRSVLKDQAVGSVRIIRGIPEALSLELQM